MLGGSCVVIGPLLRLVAIIATLLITHFIATHEPPSKSTNKQRWIPGFPHTQKAGSEQVFGVHIVSILFFGIL